MHFDCAMSDQDLGSDLLFLFFCSPAYMYLACGVQRSPARIVIMLMTPIFVFVSNVRLPDARRRL
jgi:hypothetical protein